MTKDLRSIDDLTPDSKNANQGTERGRYLLEQSLREAGAGRSIVVDQDGRVIAGNKTLEQAEALDLPIMVVKTDGRQLVVVQRTDLDLADADPNNRARKLAYFDNRAGEIGLSWDGAQIAADLEAGLELDIMFREEEIGAILEGAADALMPDFQPVGEDEQGRLDQKKPVTCPECGHEFTP